MAIMTCQACDRLTSISTEVTCTDTTVTIVVTDPCCKVRDCKMLKAIVTSSYCNWVGDPDTNLPNTDAANVPETLAAGDCCCKLVAAPTLDLTVSTLTGVFTDDYSAVDDGDQGAGNAKTVAVTPPFSYHV